MRNMLICSGRVRRVLVALSAMVTVLSLEAVAQEIVCPEEHYTLTTQAEVDAFPQDCSAVTGDLRLESWNGDITDLAPLVALTRIGGNLSIVFNSALTNIDGLSSLTSLGGDLTIDENYALTNIDGLSSLTSIPGNLSIGYNLALANINGLSGLTFVGEDLLLGGSQWFEYSTFNLDPLSKLITIGGALRLNHLYGVADLDGLSSLTSIEELHIADCPIQNVDALSWVTSLRSLSIEGTHLVNLDAFSGLTSLESLSIGGNGSLTNLNGLSGLTSVGNLRIAGNNGFTNLDAFSSLSSLGRLHLENTYYLENVDGLSGLTAITGDLLIRLSGRLTNLDGLSGLRWVGGELQLYTNPGLTNLDGLSRIAFVGENLRIISNNALSNLDGLSRIDSVGGKLEIRNNAGLGDIDGLSGITSVGVDVEVVDNKELTSCSCGLYVCVSRGCVAGSVSMIGNAQSGDCNRNGADLVINECAAPDAVDLLTPDNGATEVAAYTRFSWQPLDGAAAYHLQVGSDAALSSLVINDSTLTDVSFTVTEPLAYSTDYYWHVRAALDDGLGKTTGLLFGPWSETRSFTIAVGTATEDEPGIPTAFALHPAYPNPFNPSTTIRYDVPEAAEVRLIVYDALGRQVGALRTAHSAPGWYTTVWEASGRPSGVYFVRMDAGNFTETTRMILVK